MCICAVAKNIGTKTLRKSGRHFRKKLSHKKKQLCASCLCGKNIIDLNYGSTIEGYIVHYLTWNNYFIAFNTYEY